MTPRESPAVEPVGPAVERPEDAEPATSGRSAWYATGPVLLGELVSFVLIWVHLH